MSPEYRLVAIDLDGTLLSSDRSVPEENRRALADCRSAGVTIAIVTGRRFPGALPFLRNLPVDAFVVANSGAIIKSGVEGEILRRRLLRLSLAERILRIAADRKMEPVVHDGPNAEGFLFLHENARGAPHLSSYLNQSDPAPRWSSEVRLERDPVQIGFASDVRRIRELASHIESELGTRAREVNLSRTEYPVEDFALLDVLAHEATKAEALAFLCGHIDIPLSATVAIGDNWNDLDMLERAGLGVVMANAVTELRSRGFAETSDNDHAGVAKAIDRYVLGGRNKKIRG